MDTIKASTAVTLGLWAVLGWPAAMAAQSQPNTQQGKPTVRHHRVPVTDAAADPVYTPVLAEAETALDKKNYAKAETLLKQVVRDNDKNYRAWFDLGSLYAATDRKPEAVTALQKSVALKPDAFESNLNLGLVLASSGQNQAAAISLRKATTLKPSAKGIASQELANAWMSLGRVLEQSAPADAIASFREAARLAPHDPEPHLAAAGLLTQQKNHADAQKEYEQVLGVTPQSKEALAGLSNALIAQNKFPEAEAILRKSITADPQNPIAHLQLARLCVASQRHDEAVTEFTAALQLAPDDRNLKRELAVAATEARKYPLAEQLYRELARADTNNAELRLALGTLLMKQRKFPEAETEFLQALKLDPSLTEGYGNLAIVASENGQYELAIKALDQRARLAPENPATYFLRATCYDHLKAFKQASENYHKFLEVAEGKFPTQEWQARHRLIAIEPKK